MVEPQQHPSSISSLKSAFEEKTKLKPVAPPPAATNVATTAVKKNVDPSSIFKNDDSPQQAAKEIPKPAPVKKLVNPFEAQAQ